jgi:glycosyltransferase involved in cell wall biosynthesis
MNITFFGTYNTATTPRIQVMIDGLRAHDIAVTECNAPLNVSTKQRVALLRQPWKIPLLVASIIGCWIRLMSHRRHIPISQAVIVGHLGQFDIHLARRLFRRQQLILDYMISGSDTARDRGVNSGLKLKLLTWLDTAALRAADIVLVDTEEHRLRVPAKYRHKAVVMLVGASESWFSSASKLAASGPLKVIFFGNYTPLQGTPTIGEALGKLRVPIDVTMVGGGQDEVSAKQAAAAKESAATITWLDWVASDKLPTLVASHDVCLGIFGTGPKAYRVVPNKIYQGAAVGCALITADTPPQRRILEDAALLVPAGDPQALTAALERLAGSPNEVNKLKRAAHALAKKNFRPETVVQPLLSRLNQDGSV